MTTTYSKKLKEAYTWTWRKITLRHQDVCIDVRRSFIKSNPDIITTAYPPHTSSYRNTPQFPTLINRWFSFPSQLRLGQVVMQTSGFPPILASISLVRICTWLANREDWPTASNRHQFNWHSLAPSEVRSWTLSNAMRFTRSRSSVAVAEHSSRVFTVTVWPSRTLPTDFQSPWP